MCAVELLSIMDKLTEKLKNKRDDLLLTSDIGIMLVSLEINGEITRRKFTDICTVL